MYHFFENHKGLRTMLDWFVVITVGFTIMVIFSGTSLQDAWFVPIYINLFIICLFAYFDWVHEPKDNRMDLSEWMNNIRWINGIALGLHSTFGFFKKGSFDVVVPAMWEQSRSVIILTLSIYFFMIVVPSIIIEIKKRH
ncbi:MAG: hypothetical protein RR565_03400 [Erysipelothrix sp.]